MLIEVSQLSTLKKVRQSWLPNFPQVVDSHTTGVAHVRCGGNQITMSGDY
jgi:hypothetical protein